MTSSTITTFITIHIIYENIRKKRKDTLILSLLSFGSVQSYHPISDCIPTICSICFNVPKKYKTIF